MQGMVYSIPSSYKEVVYLSYIAPNTTVMLLRDIPLDNSYINTLYFASPDSQYNYFVSHNAYTFSQNTYQRVNKGVMRMQIPADNIYTCNYLMFQNSNFGSKWFYAFITRVDYVNNITSEIEYQIDVMQTWHFDYELKSCFVEREHAASDDIGDNIEPENLELGEYVFNSYSAISSLKLHQLLVIIAIVDTNDKTDGKLYDGIYGGATLWAFNSDDINGINEKINEYAQKPEAVISMYVCPTTLYEPVSPGGKKIENRTEAKQHGIFLETLNTSMDLDGYKPQNNKLYTYPYNYLHIDNASGDTLSLRYEFFNDLTPTLIATGVITQPVQVVLRPYKYKGVSGFEHEKETVQSLNTEMITLSNYPLCSWNVDSYQAYIAQNSVVNKWNLITESLGSGISAIGSAGIAKTIGSLLGVGAATIGMPQIAVAAGGAALLSGINENLQKRYQASIKADIERGSISSANVNVSNGKQQFYAGRASITSRRARNIDNYFSMFGYATNRVKVPNITSRPHWNYIKTAGCNAVGSVPAEDMSQITAIYDSGITFWKNGDEVGEYSLNNNI